MVLCVGSVLVGRLFCEVGMCMCFSNRLNRCLLYSDVFSRVLLWWVSMCCQVFGCCFVMLVRLLISVFSSVCCIVWYWLLCCRFLWLVVGVSCEDLIILLMKLVYGGSRLCVLLFSSMLCMNIDRLWLLLVLQVVLFWIYNRLVVLLLLLVCNGMVMIGLKLCLNCVVNCSVWWWVCIGCMVIFFWLCYGGGLGLIVLVVVLMKIGLDSSVQQWFSILCRCVLLVSGRKLGCSFSFILVLIVCVGILLMVYCLVLLDMYRWFRFGVWYEVVCMLIWCVSMKVDRKLRLNMLIRFLLFLLFWCRLWVQLMLMVVR